MNRSESIKELAAAMCKAQATLKGAEKSATNPHYNSKYADLESVFEACREPLTSNGLVVMQFPSTTDDGKPTRVNMETLMVHASGEWISEVLSARPTKDDPQGIGSCITYLRRYGLQCVVGIAPAGEDDDGEAASRPAPAATAKPKAAPPAARPKPAGRQGNDDGEGVPDDDLRRRVTSMLLEMNAGDQEAAIDELEQATAFTAKDGTEVAGKRETARLSPKALRVTYSKIKKNWLTFKETAPPAEEVPAWVDEDEEVEV